MKNPDVRRRRPTVFVLWGEHYDEVGAVLAVTTLREAGWRVKVVGVSGPSAKGSHGLGLHADCTLDDALAAADGAIGVVIPCTMPTFQRAWVDPRVQALIAKVQENAHGVVVQISSGVR